MISWLYRPPVADSPEGSEPRSLPLVVVAYPGGSGRRPSNPAEFNAMSNVQLLAAAGYAVLSPTLPRSEPSTPDDGLAEQVVSVLDAVLAANPDLDASRVGYLGHSFGGYAGLVLATRTDRFASYVILSAPSDLASAWGSFSGFGRADQAFGVTTRRNAGWGEEAQGAVGGPPWTRPAIYTASSPLYAADRITAPVLLIHGELDFIPVGQAELVFSALWRQNKDVRLAIYWGEHHLINSPGNIRDIHARTLDWFATTLGQSRVPGSGETSLPATNPGLQ